MTGAALCTGADSVAARFVARTAPASPTILRLAQEDLQQLPIQELELLIASDPEFSLRVLALANSAFYSQQHDVLTLRSAVVVLGIETISRLAASVWSRSLLTGPNPSDDTLWRHALATGIAAQMMAEAHRLANPQHCFVAGLLHDIGMCAIQADALGGTEVDAHAAVGAEIATLLGLAPGLATAILHHDDAEGAGESDAVNATVAAANQITIRAGLCHDAESESQDQILAAALERLGLEHEDSDAFLIGLERRLDSFERAFGASSEVVS